MIHKHAVWLIGLVTCLAWGSGYSQSSNEVAKADLGARLAAQKVSQIGDPAPRLVVQEWIKGKPVKIQPGTNIYVIVFCTLSQANEFALTNLSSLQRLYQDKGLLTVVISDEAPGQLREFVRFRGNDINFTVAADGLASRTAGNYQLAFNQFMSPRAYVVGKDGNVLWYGHPLRDGMGEVVDEIVSGRYNLEQTRKSVVAKQQMELYLSMVRQNDPEAAQSGQAMLRSRFNDAPALCDMAYQIATDPFQENRDVALANAALDRAEQLASTNATDIALDRAILLFHGGRPQEGLAHARKALTTAKTDAEKGEANFLIHAMEARVAANQSSQTNHLGVTNVPADEPKP
jgi:hypothetical protein